MAQNSRTSKGSNPDDPYVGAVVINYGGGDQTIDPTCRGVFVGGAGNLAVVFIDGSAVTLTGLTAGTVYRLAIKKVVQTGSTATNCVALL